MMDLPEQSRAQMKQVEQSRLDQYRRGGPWNAYRPSCPDELQATSTTSDENRNNTYWTHKVKT